MVLKSGDMCWIDVLGYLTEMRPELEEKLLLIPEGYEHPKGSARFSGESVDSGLV